MSLTFNPILTVSINKAIKKILRDQIELLVVCHNIKMILLSTKQVVKAEFFRAIGDG